MVLVITSWWLFSFLVEYYWHILRYIWTQLNVSNKILLACFLIVRNIGAKLYWISTGLDRNINISPSSHEKWCQLAKWKQLQANLSLCLQPQIGWVLPLEEKLWLDFCIPGLQGIHTVMAEYPGKPPCFQRLVHVRVFPVLLWHLPILSI